MEYSDTREGCRVGVTPPNGIPFAKYDWTEKEIKALEETFKSVINIIRTKEWLIKFPTEVA